MSFSLAVNSMPSIFSSSDSNIASIVSGISFTVCSITSIPSSSFVEVSKAFATFSKVVELMFCFLPFSKS